MSSGELFGARLRLMRDGRRLELAAPVPDAGAWRDPKRWTADPRTSEGPLGADDPWPLLDLALQFARVLRPEDFGVTPPRWMTGPEAAEFDPASVIGFTGVEGRRPIIEPSFLADLRGSIGEAAFDAGVRAFLQEFIRETHRHAPTALEWDAFSVLRRYAST